MSKTTEAKAAALLAQGKVKLVKVDDSSVYAVVFGSSPYDVRFHRISGWTCTCPAGEFGNDCYHKLAVKLVCLRKAEVTASLSEKLPEHFINKLSEQSDILYET